jgi:glutamyl-tRNA synthetase
MRWTVSGVLPDAAASGWEHPAADRDRLRDGAHAPCYDRTMTDRDVPAGTVRTRFAPSPTGFLHVGTARTALFNYLFARRHGGRFLLRIEDTDVERNVADGAEGIVDALRWLGLAWDEGYAVGGEGGPHVQSRRLDRYRTAVNTLIATGHAYPCYCTPKELEERAAAARARGLPPGYDGHCRELTGRQVQAYEAEGRPAAVRFRLPDDGRTVVDDLVHGRVVFENATLSDFVILRASGMPTYLFAAPYDDVDMRVSHVIRGDDLLPSTPRQVHVFAALGRPDPPAFAHVPLLVGADARKLSKRHGAVAVETFRADGYLPEALVNYLALLGWSYDDRTELFRLEELERVFSIERVTQNPATFDTRKLEALNGHYIRELDPAEFARRALPFVCAAVRPDADPEVLTAAAPLVLERVRLLGEVPGMVGFLYVDRVTIDQADAAKVLGPEGRELLAAAAKALATLGPWTAGAIEAALRGLQQERGLSAKKAFQPVRLAITGRLVSPPLFESMALLGKARSLARIEAALGDQGV